MRGCGRLSVREVTRTIERHGKDYPKGLALINRMCEEVIPLRRQEVDEKFKYCQLEEEGCACSEAIKLLIRPNVREALEQYHDHGIAIMLNADDNLIVVGVNSFIAKQAMEQLSKARIAV